MQRMMYRKRIALFDDYMLEEPPRACVDGWYEVIPYLCDSGRERHANQIVDLLHAENFSRNEIRETP